MSSVNIFFASDWHLEHYNILTFLRYDGSKLRDFSNIQEHDEYIIQQHNKVVKPQDKIYILGDCCFSKSALSKIKRMHGTKVLIKGNHDTLKTELYLEYFKDVRSVHLVAKGLCLSHIPIHPDCLSRWGINIHGHLHANKILLDGIEDNRYINVSMEQLNDYTPISLEEIKQITGPYFNE